MKRCSRCKQGKLTSEFHKRSNSKDGLQPTCKPCMINKSKENYSPSTYRRQSLKRRYGISLDDYDCMFTQQNGCCAICGTDEPMGRWKRFCVDHDHNTSQVRALLCNNCNQGIGYLNDDPDLLNKAADYIRTFRGK